MARDDMRSRVKKMIGIASLMLAFLLIFSTGVYAETNKETLLKKCNALLEDIDTCLQRQNQLRSDMPELTLDLKEKETLVQDLKRKIQNEYDGDLRYFEGMFDSYRSEVPIYPITLDGMTNEDAEEWLELRGIAPGKKEEYSSTVEKGVVIGTETRTFSKISFFTDEGDRTLTYTVSMGPEPGRDTPGDGASTETTQSTTTDQDRTDTETETGTETGTDGKDEKNSSLTTEGKTDGSTSDPFSGSGNGGDNLKGDAGGEKSWISQNWILLLIIGILAIALIIAIVFILTSGKKKKRKQLSEIRKGYTANQTNYPGQGSSMGAAYQQPNRLPEEDKDEKTLLLSNVQSRGINAHLISVRTGVDFPLKITARTVVGSGADCDCTINDPAFALRQFMLEWNGEDVYIDDLNTATGTRMNGTPLRHKRRMESEDRIGVGESEYIIRW